MILFEILKSDLAARIGILHTNHGKVETPAYVPVVHPVKQSIPLKKFREIGFDLVITNAYITRNRYGQNAIDKGIHGIIDFDGSVMTDSGGYQVLEYGDLSVSPEDMAKFERDIKTDIAIPLDKPTGFGLPRKKAEAYVEKTLKVSKETLENSEDNGQIWVGPIQGGEHFDLVKKSTQRLVEFGFDMLALGSPVEFMESYEYKLLAQMIISAKKQMPASIPLHLFGAGHPLTIPFAVALGCDTFDSASYMLYAKQGRYITEDRTRHLSDISYFSCNCEICTKYSPKELDSEEIQSKIDKLALHNLYTIKAEVDRVKESIVEGRLWEYVIKKCRAHPKLFEVIDVFIENSRYFVNTTPKFKEKAIFFFSPVDQFRPEVLSFQKIVQEFRTKKKKLVLTQITEDKPAYLSKEYQFLKTKFPEDKFQFCQYSPFLGLIPNEISDVFPAAHHVTSRLNYNAVDFPKFSENWEIFFKKNKFSEIHYNKDDVFISEFVKRLPKSIAKKSILKIRKKSSKDTV